MANMFGPGFESLQLHLVSIFYHQSPLKRPVCGLFCDVQKLKRAEITVGVDGEKWIFANRKKNDIPLRIPLLPFAETLLNIYQNNVQCIIADVVFPVFSNQKMNAYLKEIVDVCGVKKNLTSHMARHTFATTITLNNDVPIETVSKMLGHKISVLPSTMQKYSI